MGTQDPITWEYVDARLSVQTFESLIKGGRLHAYIDFDKSTAKYDKRDVTVMPPSEVERSNVWLSISERDPSYHLPVLDVDVPRRLTVENDILVASPGRVLLYHQDRVRWVPSTTAGHHHVYIDYPMTWEVYREYLTNLKDRGVLEPGYVNVSIKREFTVVRKPHIKKIVCTGLTARWCPIHGDCNCGDPLFAGMDGLSEQWCALHSADSDHAATSKG